MKPRQGSASGQFGDSLHSLATLVFTPRTPSHVQDVKRQAKTSHGHEMTAAFEAQLSREKVRGWMHYSAEQHMGCDVNCSL